MKNIFKQKGNILVIMFALVVIMGIGFAAYSQQLTIKDTSSINSNWNVYIKSVSAGTPVGGATGNGTVDNKTTATLATELKYPGDSITYTITVANEGSIDAEVEKVELKAAKENTVIKYSILEEANIQYLNQGEEKSFKVKVEYDPTKTGTATEEQKSNSLTLTVDYVQKGTGSGTYVPGGNTDNFTGTVYSSNLLTYTEDDFNNEMWKKENLIYNGGLINKIKGYTEDYTSLNTNYFLKHIINNGIVESNELCFIHNGLQCLKPNEYETTKANLLNIFGESACHVSNVDINCADGLWRISSYSSGIVLAQKNSAHSCVVESIGYTYCGTLE